MNLPSGWQFVEMNELATKIGSGATPKGGKEAYHQTGTPLIRSMNVRFGGFARDGLAFIDDIQARALENVTVRRQDVLLNITGASIGRVCLAPDEMLGARVNQHVCIIRLVEEMLPTYIEKFLAAPEMQRYILEENYGLTRQALTKSMVESILVPVPPAAEQRRLVTKLDAFTERLARARAELDTLPKLAALCRQTALEQAFRGELNSDQLEKKPTENWDFVPASDVCLKVQSGGTPKDGFHKGDVPFLKVYNVVRQKIDFKYRSQYVSRALHENALKKSVAYPGDVVMNIVGPPLGKVAIIPDEFPEWNLNQALAIFRPSERIISKWLYYYLRSGESIRSVINQTRGIVGQVNISLSQCRSFVLPVPPVAKQIEIVQKIEKAFARADHLEAEAARARVLIDRLEAAVLAKAFRGELVPQDPNDESASALLNRIRTERTALHNPKRGRRVKA